MTPTAQPFSDQELFARRSQRTFKGRGLLQIATAPGRDWRGVHLPERAGRAAGFLHPQ